jgi:hypothetical protein
MFFFTKKKIVLDCFTNRIDVYNYNQIDYGTKFFPEWWKNLPKKIDREKTAENFWIQLESMKSCPGFIESYKNTAVVPMWTDFDIKFGPEGNYNWFFADETVLAHHPEKQHTGMFPGGKYHNRKINSPWLFTCKEDVKFNMEPMFYNYNRPDDYNICPGIVNYRDQHAVNIIFMIEEVARERMFELRLSQPLVALRPLSERTLEIKNHLIDDNEFARIKREVIVPKFSHSFRFVKKANDENKESKCPFGFGK